jgi:hypothetical protein
MMRSRLRKTWSAWVIADLKRAGLAAAGYPYSHPAIAESLLHHCEGGQRIGEQTEWRVVPGAHAGRAIFGAP